VIIDADIYHIFVKMGSTGDKVIEELDQFTEKLF